jgi:hypothetical protein
MLELPGIYFKLFLSALNVYEQILMKFHPKKLKALSGINASLPTYSVFYPVGKLE